MALFLLLWIFLSYDAWCQSTGVLVSGANGSPDASAIMEVRSSDQGFLLPRVALTATNSASPVSSPATSLLVYNTVTAGSGATQVTPGYYYWSGAQWVRLITADNSLTGSGTAGQVTYWSGSNSLTGNSGFTFDGTDLTLSTDGNIVMPSNTSELQFNGSTGPHGVSFVGGEAAIYYRTSPNNLLIEDALANPIFSADIDDRQVGIGIDEPVSLLHVSAGTSGDAELIIEADTDDSNESDNPFITFKQDANASNGFIGLEGTDGTRSTGTTANALVIGSEDADPDVQFITDDSVRVTVTNDGNVGIGTSGPQGKLEVIGDIWISSSSDNSLRIRPDLAAGSQYGFDDTYEHTMALVNEQGSTNQAIVIGDSNDGDATTLFGVSVNTGGASNPSTGSEAEWDKRFEILGTGTVKLNAYTTNGVLTVSGGDGTVSVATGSDLPSGSNDYIQNQLATDQAAGFRIDGNGIFNGGNVGIGLTAPSAPLHVLEGQTVLGRFEQSITSGADAKLEVVGARNACTTCEIAAIDLNDYDSNEGSGTEFTMARVFGGMAATGGQLGYLGFMTNPGSGVAEQMRISEIGNVGIGVSDPTAKLHIVGTTGGDGGWDDGGIVVKNTGSSGEAAISFNNSDAGSNYWMIGLNQSEHYDISYGTTFTNGNTKMRIETGGNVGIGTVSPNALLDVEGDFRITGEDSKVEFNTKESNNGWTLIYRDDFKTSNDGWNLYESNTSSSVASGEFQRDTPGIIGVSSFLNNYANGTNDSDNNNVFKKLFDMSGVSWTEAQITFDYFFIDSWDARERGYAGVASSLTGNPTILWVENHDNSDDTQGRIDYSFIGGSEGDQVRTAMLHVRNNVIGNGNFYLIIGSTLNEDRSNESFGIDNVEIWAR
ncbi:MAG: hypothetical protein K9J17_09445 [Flavobacteriales bacterium]|nr:hypothetical protein [Flavobacteriales bacterium]